MKPLSRGACIALILALVASPATLSCGSRNPVLCSTRDSRALFAPDAAKSPESPEDSWIRNARVCDMGEYWVMTPAEGGSKLIFVLRKSGSAGTLFAVTSDSTNLFDPDKKRGLRGLVAKVTRDETALFNVDGRGDTLIVSGDSITLADVDKKRTLLAVAHGQSERNFVSYSAYDPSQGAWIENIDSGPDGNLDLRRTEITGRPLKTEFRVGERWLERVERDGQVGTILDGRFMSMADARARLGVKDPWPK